MGKSLHRTPVAGPAFVRLLARLGQTSVPPLQQSLPDRLGQWVDWNRAVVLSRALDGTPAPAPEGTPAFDAAEDHACAQARAALVAGIEAACAHAVAPGADGVVDFAPFRRRIMDQQRAMQATTGQLRGRLRERLAAAPAPLPRLAEVDAVMELTLSPREQTLLDAVPGLLAAHFARAQPAPSPSDEPAPPPAPETWQDAFREDMRQVLLAELDVRFHPIEALLAALRPHASGHHAH